MHAYNPHLLAYSFKRTDTLSLLSSDQLVFPEVHHERKLFVSKDEVYLATAIFQYHALILIVINNWSHLLSSHKLHYVKLTHSLFIVTIN